MTRVLAIIADLALICQRLPWHVRPATVSQRRDDQFIDSQFAGASCAIEGRKSTTRLRAAIAADDAAYRVRNH